jgi:hypothetical protein
MESGEIKAVPQLDTAPENPYSLSLVAAWADRKCWPRTGGNPTDARCLAENGLSVALLLVAPTEKYDKPRWGREGMTIGDFSLVCWAHWCDKFFAMRLQRPSH